MRVLIVGAGIAGPTLAFWLRQLGHEPTIVEQAPRLRRGGYLVDFWGAGYDVAERMGIVPTLVDKGHRLRELREVAADGRPIASFDPRTIAGAASERYVTIARADLASTIFDALDGNVETIFGDTIETLDDDGGKVRVGFAGGTERDFDLVVGADGLHSRVRRLAFGSQSRFERYQGIAVAAFDIEGYLPRDELVAVTHTEVGVQALRLAMADGATMFLFVFRHDGRLPADDVAAQRELLVTRLRGVGWEIPAILRQLERARTFYFDRVSQIRMPSWSRGRVTLIGDAAACPSLLAGQGSALAMVEAYVLAVELARADGDHRAAFDAYEQQVAPLVRTKQDAALRLGSAFAPRNGFELLLRNTAIRLMRFPPVAKLAMGRTLRDPIRLPPVPAD